MARNNKYATADGSILVEDIVHEYAPRLKAFISHNVGNEQDAEDLLQDVFYQLVRHANEGTGIERMSAWLFRVARNAVFNFWRKRREDELLPFSTDDDDIACEEFSEVLFGGDNPTPDVAFLRKLVWEELDRALQELPPEQRNVFCLTTFDGIPLKEISAATGISVATLLSRKHYAVLFLRNRLRELYEDIVGY